MPCGISDDYAYVDVEGTVEFYFGYELQTDSGEWCFRARFADGREVVIPKSELPGSRNFYNMEDCLLAGIAMVLEGAKIEMAEGMA